MSIQATVSINMLHALNVYAKEKGIAVDEINRRLGLDFAHLSLNNSRIPAPQYQQFWHALLQESADDDFGLHIAVASNTVQKKNDILFSILSNSPTIECALKNLIRYHALSTDFVKARLESKQNTATLSWETAVAHHIQGDRHYAECILAILAFLLRYLSDGGIRLAKVTFQHHRPAHTEEHARIFQCPVLFDKPNNELSFSARYLLLPISQTNTELLDILEHYALRLLDKLNLHRRFTQKTADSINRMLLKGEKPSLEKIAGELSSSARNLQNKLKEESTTYQFILEQLRKEIALAYLKKRDVPICEIAFLLGFTEQSSFNHAFRKWTGSTPKEYRASD